MVSDSQADSDTSPGPPGPRTVPHGTLRRRTSLSRARETRQAAARTAQPALLAHCCPARRAEAARPLTIVGRPAVCSTCPRHRQTTSNPTSPKPLKAVWRCLGADWLSRTCSRPQRCLYRSCLCRRCPSTPLAARLSVCTRRAHPASAVAVGCIPISTRRRV